MKVSCSSVSVHTCPYVSLLLAVTRRLGVPEDWIVQHVRDSPTFRNVPAPRVVAAIVKLLDTSQIYTVTAKSYKCIT